ncbi:MAG: helix-turn-helix domain-containing protein [Actinomycetospora chiangmaiensis]|nr:helix-turn-helix domain-containing protein [Actinomycetospora chiangmaiensis]
MPKTPRFPPDAPRPVEMLAFEGVQLLDVAGPLQVFATANERGVIGQPYAPRVIAAGEPMLTASAGLRLMADPLPELDAPLDTLVVAGGPGVLAACDDPGLVAWVRARAGRARRVASVCTGAFLLGAAGLLDGRRAVTHWKHCSALAARYPRARVEPDPIFVQDGPVWSSAGVTAGIDLTLALVEADLGRPLALAVARHLVMFLKRPGGQAQFSAALALQAGEERFGQLHAFIGENLSGDLSLPALAAAAGMSERSLSRHYRDATGLTPARAVERLRVEAARRALAETAQPVKRIAQVCGFGSEETMRRSFLRHVAATPQDYRARFGG